MWSSYNGAWHFESDLVDAVSGAAATDGGTSEMPGKLGAARAFDGANSYIDVAASATVDDVFAGGGTASAWCKATSFGENARGRIFDKGASVTTGWLLSYDNSNVASSVLFTTGATQEGEWNTPAASVPTAEWVHVAVVYDRDSTANVPQLFLNGQMQACTPNPTPTGTIPPDAGLALRIGNRTALDRTFDGLIDEPRISTHARSAGWLDTEYRNQNAPATFLTVGPEL